MLKRPRPGLYAVTPDGLETPRLLMLAEAALAAGIPLLQYRDKSGDDARRREQATALLALCRRHGTRLIINDDAALAREVDADGVHLGGEDGDLAAARALLGPDKLIGASCYADFARAQAAAAGANYVAFGAMYASPTKPQAPRAPFNLVTRARQELPGVQVAAIGGITLDNAAPVIAAGAQFVAVITDLFEAPDVTARAAAYQRLFAESAAHELS
ncbi:MULTISPECIES: thiamine phosphate synthase [Azospira]|uniref:Thiamine-phosphate synthase n=1 Tax=Azospira oryzae (strain ATCC BAA-33 / DSM 13638 / PS) TaxID=640081 RepID=G8QGJ4_AZOOP|nr:MULTISPECIES: thiamine phosphate synthase [Azospira]AEV25073.1 thiamine-phosphate pyrophosphorylase [Azospira oryzae PS]MDK9691388.1 thiamine phosphate synthase [Azospira sp.]